MLGFVDCLLCLTEESSAGVAFMSADGCIFVYFPSQARPLSKSFQRGEDPQFDQLISCLHAVAEHCLPALLRTLFAWYDRQNVDYSHLHPPLAGDTGKQKADSSKSGSGSTKSTLEFMEKEHLTNKRNLAIDYLFALVLIEILKQVCVCMCS
jgi:hypothetical protein